MITGVVNAQHEASIRLLLRGTRRGEWEVEAILDTGFNGALTLAPAIIAALGLPWRSRGLVILANGAEEQCDIYTATVLWDGTPRSILIEAADTDPLVGMGLLHGYEVCVQVVAGGGVTIEMLP